MRSKVYAERVGKWWSLESDNGAVSQVRSLAQAEAEMREAVAFLADLSESEIEIELVITPPAKYVELAE